MKRIRSIYKLGLLTGFLGLCSVCLGQLQSIGFLEKVIVSSMDNNLLYYSPECRVIGDTLYVCSHSGVFQKNLKDHTEWELTAFAGIPVIEFVKNEHEWLAVAFRTNNRSDSLFLYSKDDGKTVEDYTSPYFSGKNEFLFQVAQNPLNPRSIVVTHGYGTSKSVDFGKSWMNLTESGLQSFLSFHPLDTSAIFFSGRTGFFRGLIGSSSDNGEVWNYYSSSGGYINNIIFHPSIPSKIFYAGEGIGRSDDGGKTWEENKISTEAFLNKVLFDQTDPSVLYAIGMKIGADESSDTLCLFRSIDGGDNWYLAYKEKESEDFGGLLDVVPYKQKLIFYTRNAGLFELDLETIPLAKESVEAHPELLIYPNPVRDQLCFESEASIQRVEVLDAGGRLVCQIKVPEGSTCVDIPSVSPGAYLAVFHTNQAFTTKKIFIVN